MRRSFVNAAILIPLFFTGVSAQDLESGHVEMRFLGGTNYSYPGPSREIWPTYSIEGAIGVTRWIAATAGYTRDMLPDSNITGCSLFPTGIDGVGNCTYYASGRRIQEFMGGVRVSGVNPTHFTPFAQVSVGAVRQTTDSFHAATVSFSGSEFTRFGVAPGVGLDVKLTRHLGIAFDARAVKAVDFHWFYRATGGMFLRF
jgi:sorbitol-specific phosphotransferase system component IIA